MISTPSTISCTINPSSRAPAIRPTAAASAQAGPALFSTEELLADLGGRGKRAKILATNDLGLKALAKELRSGDVVLVMSNGSFDGLLPKLLQTISG